VWPLLSFNTFRISISVITHHVSCLYRIAEGVNSASDGHPSSQFLRFSYPPCNSLFFFHSFKVVVPELPPRLYPPTRPGRVPCQPHTLPSTARALRLFSKDTNHTWSHNMASPAQSSGVDGRAEELRRRNVAGQPAAGAPVVAQAPVTEKSKEKVRALYRSLAQGPKLATTMGLES
jgi:hypothetical protein